MSFYSKSIAITGAARGIGFELVNQLSANPSFHVLALVRDVKSSIALQELGRSNVSIIAFDITDKDSVKLGAEEISKLTGGKLDVLINNAGVLPSASRLIDEKLDVIEHTVNINVYGAISVTQTLLPLLRAGKDKVIVNFSAVLGSNGFLLSPNNIFASAGAYNLTKGANVLVNTLLANELQSEGFTALAWHPGWVSTTMGNSIATETIRPPVTPEESAKALVGVLAGLSTEDNGKFLGLADPEGTIFTVPF